MDNNGKNKPEIKQVSCEVKKKNRRDGLKLVIISLTIFAAILLIFGAGVFVGSVKARFSYRWAENYHRNFGGPRGGFMADWRNFSPSAGDFIEGHGTFGEIIKINGSDFVIKGQEDVEKIIIISEDTLIKKGRDTIKKEELKVGNRATIIGSPDEKGQIKAKLIRIFEDENARVLRENHYFPFFK